MDKIVNKEKGLKKTFERSLLHKIVYIYWKTNIAFISFHPVIEVFIEAIVRVSRLSKEDGRIIVYTYLKCIIT